METTLFEELIEKMGKYKNFGMKFDKILKIEKKLYFANWSICGGLTLISIKNKDVKCFS